MLKRISQGDRGSLGGTARHTLSLQTRAVQFEETSGTRRGMNENRRRFSPFTKTGDKNKSSSSGGNKNEMRNRDTSVKWITKSTRDYMNEVGGGAASVPLNKPSKDTAASAGKNSGNNISSSGSGGGGVKSGEVKPAEGIFTSREEFKEFRLKRNAQLKRATEEGFEMYANELDRMHDDTGKQYQKSINFFKRQGKDFILTYVITYVVCLVGFYLCFATGLVPKEHVFNYIFLTFRNYINRDDFYSRIERWDTYINCGFAFVVNEVVEVIRFPIVCTLYFQIKAKRKANIQMRPSIFKTSAPHK